VRKPISQTITFVAIQYDLGFKFRGSGRGLQQLALPKPDDNTAVNLHPAGRSRQHWLYLLLKGNQAIHKQRCRCLLAAQGCEEVAARRTFEPPKALKASG